MLTRCEYENAYAKRIQEALYKTKITDTVRYFEQKCHECDDVDCDDVYNDKIFIGNEFAARNKRYLKFLGITHVLNCAEGASPGMVNTNEQYYTSSGIVYKGFHMLDLPVVDIGRFFEEGANFIEDCLKQYNGKVLVHCYMGMSRSATIVLAYLMIKKRMSGVDAMIAVRQRRHIHPNEGFIRCLAKLQYSLDHEKLY